MRRVRHVGLDLSAVLAAWLLTAVVAPAADVVRVTPADSLASLRQRLAADPDIAEVVFEEGTYAGGLSVSAPEGPEASMRPLMIRAAEGADVVLDGSRLVEQFQPHAELPAVFFIEYAHRGGEYPKLWEPGARSRYRLVADRQAVARFPATYTVEGDRLLFQTSDGQAPRPGELLMSVQDCGLFVNRPQVTVRGLTFQNYLAREKWSTGVDLRADHITVEDCSARNCSLGFVVSGDNNVVRRCTTEDVGGGVYVGGETATVEECRLTKRRDGYMVPMYAQDDTGIQFYHPARGGIVRGNLCVGFGMGVFLKARTAPYRVEHNTLVGLGQGLGFGATSWHLGQRFRYNIIADCTRQVEIPSAAEGEPRDVDFNCYWSAARSGLEPIGPHDVVADPQFVSPEWGDYRLATGSPCLALGGDARPCGAFGAAGEPIGLDPPREWHVSETGRDAADGTHDRPVATIQAAVDRARPGDSIVVHPGLYPDPVRVTRGGTEDRPIIIRAAAPGRAVLDSNRAASVMIRIENAPYVELRDLEIRWYGSVAVDVHESPHVTVTGCRIWNAHWGGAWPTGRAVRVVRSPGFTGRHNLLFQQEHGFWLYHSPRATLVNNTCASNLYAAAAFLYSCGGSVCRNNSFAFQGNDVIVVGDADREKLTTFDCDYNNYGTPMRPQPEGTAFDGLAPRPQETHFRGGSKAIVNYWTDQGESRRFVSLAAWREHSGLDRHTIFADPLYVDTASRDFGIDPQSPNRGAGADGATIGAVED